MVVTGELERLMFAGGIVISAAGRPEPPPPGAETLPAWIIWIGSPKFGADIGMMLSDSEFFVGAAPPVDDGAGAGTREVGSLTGRTDTPLSSNVELSMMHSKSAVPHVVLPQLVASAATQTSIPNR